MKFSFFFALSLPVLAHHGQDFLVTLDTGTTVPWEFRTTIGGEYTRYSGSHEASATQTVILGLPHRFSLSSTIRLADESSGSWDSLSITPTLQWSAPNLNLSGAFSTLGLAAAFGWEFPLEGSDSHNHDSIDLMDCSGLAGIPPLFQACQLANLNATNHTHGNGGHSHRGIHRHGEGHGFLRLIAELKPTSKDRIVFNTITVFPEDESPQWGYAFAYRRRFNEQFSLGLEAIGDLDWDGEHLIYLTGTSYLNHHLTATFGLATGLTDASPDFTIQTLVAWRF